MSSTLVAGRPKRVTPQFASIAATATGQTALVAAQTSPNRVIRVKQYAYVVGGAVNVKFQSASTDLTGAQEHSAKAEGIAAEHPDGVFETVAGEPLNINLSGNVNVSGSLQYEVI
mgnify:CR=1 FL=1